MLYLQFTQKCDPLLNQQSHYWYMGVEENDDRPINPPEVQPEIPEKEPIEEVFSQEPEDARTLEPSIESEDEVRFEETAKFEEELDKSILRLQGELRKHSNARKKTDSAILDIKKELKEWLPNLEGELEKERLSSRTKYDIEMIKELGYCSGIENYSRHFDGRKVGEPPYCLLDFFGDDFLLVIDESHVTLPQLRGMYNGDHTRKQMLVTYGFRLPSSFDNRPLKFEEFERYLRKVVFVSATPGPYELKSSSKVVEQLVRPTGLVDPIVEIRSSKNQIDELIIEIQKRTTKNQRTLVTTLTKRMAEDLAEFLSKKNIRVRYLHSEIEGLERTELIRQLRLGEFDVLIGINLLREGLDIPEVSLVIILDSDKEGFLRNDISLIQTFGRAARNIDGTVIMYADKITKSMENAILETNRRRTKQIEFNKLHRITPISISKPIVKDKNSQSQHEFFKSMSKNDLRKISIETEVLMNKYAEELDFEKAIQLRDRLKKIKQEMGIIEVQ